MKQLCRRGSLKLVVSLVVVFMLSIVAAHAQQGYGRGSYGDCQYGESCPAQSSVLPPTTVIPVPPSPDNPQYGRAFSTNITDNQVFDGSTFQVLVTPNFPAEQITQVTLLLDGQIVGQATDLQGESFVIDWQLPVRGEYVVSVVIYLADGSTVRQDFNIVVQRSLSGNVEQPDSDSISSGSEETESLWSTRFVKSIQSFVQHLVDITPTPIAYAIPYGFLILLGGIAGLLLIQTRNQLAHIVALLRLLEKDKLLADEKTTFIMLVSHHLRTPLTILGGSLDLIASQEPTKSQEIAAARAGVKMLSQKSESVLEDIINNQYLKNINVPDVISIRHELYYSWKVIAPIVFSVSILAALNLVYTAAGKTRLIIPNIFIQIVVLGILLTFGYVLLQRRQQKRQEAAHVQKQREYEAELDKARNKFILRVAKEITPIVSEIKVACGNIEVVNMPSGIGESIKRLDVMLTRFVLAAELERGKIASSSTQFSLKEVSEKVLDYQQDKAAAKQIEIKAKLSEQTLESVEFLTRYVLTSLMDNAVRYSNNESSVGVSNTLGSNDEALVTITNKGKGIAAEKLEVLFKPFTSTENVEIFNDQGMGLGLYLSRLIMRYLDGDVSLASAPGQETVATVSFPVKVN